MERGDKVFKGDHPHDGGGGGEREEEELHLKFGIE